MSLVLLDRQVRPHVSVITLNKPERLNSMSFPLVEALYEALDEVGRDNDTWVVVMTGAGRAFCSGLDLHDRGIPPNTQDLGFSRLAMRSMSYMSDVVPAMRRIPQPVIAAINGPAYGGGMCLTLGSDIRYAAPEAVFRAVFLNVGVSNCDMGTSWLLPRLIGASRAHELMLTGRRVRADEAERIGLVAEVVDADSLVDRAIEAGEQIAAWTPWGIRLTKQGMWSALEIPSERAAIEYEDRQQIMATHGVAPPEAIAAFLEKRPAAFPD